MGRNQSLAYERLVAIGKPILAPDQPGSKTVKNPDPDSFRPQNQRLRPQNPKQTRPQHEFAGISGRFDCTLEALTPLLVGDGKEPARFVGLAEYIRNPRGGSLPTVPGTSLKGAIRLL